MDTISEKSSPHIGNMLAQLLKEKRISKSELGRLLNIHSGSIAGYIKQSSMQTALLWKLGQALDFDFFAALSAKFPLKKPTETEIKLEQQLADVKKENALYKQILMGKAGG